MEDGSTRKSAFKQVKSNIKSASQGTFNSSSDTEADMSDSVVDYTLRKQCSTSILQLKTHRLGLSASHPNLIAKDDLRTPTPPSTPPIGLDITENEKDKYLTLDPVDLTNFRKWIVGFCIVNFDLEIGQGNLFLSSIVCPSSPNKSFFSPLCISFSFGLCLPTNGFNGN